MIEHMKRHINEHEIGFSCAKRNFPGNRIVIGESVWLHRDNRIRSLTVVPDEKFRFYAEFENDRDAVEFLKLLESGSSELSRKRSGSRGYWRVALRAAKGNGK